MNWLIDIALIAIVVALVYNSKKKRPDRYYQDYMPNYMPPEPALYDETRNAPLQVKGMYQRGWILTQNEKAEYRKLKSIAEELGYIVFAKVRLLDLLEPKKGIPKYKTYFYKIQAKHIDFVLCDKEKLVARILIELDDSSHNAPDRMMRDQFVDEVVQSVGYKIIHTYGITEDIREKILSLNNPEGKKENLSERLAAEQTGDWKYPQQ